MTPRSIRRAAQRKANKRARKAALNAGGAGLGPTADLTLENAFLPHGADIEASHQTNSETAQYEAYESTHTAAGEPVDGATGEQRPTRSKPHPITIPPAAEANAAITPIASALTGHFTLLPTIDAAQYNLLLRDCESNYQPAGPQESDLVQSIAEITWRTRRAVALEMAIYARGRIEFAKQFAEHNPGLRDSLLDVHTFLTYEKQIRGLQLQEARLSRRAEKQTAELRQLQKERQERDEKANRYKEEERRRQLEAAAQLYRAAKQKRQTFHPEQNGFEFANGEIESYLAEKQTRAARLAEFRSQQMHSKAA